MDTRDVELAKLVLRQGELTLQAQLQLTTAAMARATTLAGLFAVTATAAVGYMLSNYGDELALALGGAGAGAALAVGAVLCVSSVWPTAFRTAGNLPSNWWVDGVKNRPLAECLSNESDNYDDAIKRNRASMAQEAKRFKFGAWLGCMSPAIGLICWALV